MSNKEKFMQYAKKRLKEKEYKRREKLCVLSEIQISGIERCARGRWRAGQR
jgi:hypothetical protein